MHGDIFSNLDQGNFCQLSLVSDIKIISVIFEV